MLMLELADGTPCQVCIGAAVYAPRTHGVEVYGDRATLVLSSHNQKDYVHGFHLWANQPGESPTELEVPMRLSFGKTYTDGRIAPFIRVVEQWVQGIDKGEALTPSLGEGVYSQLLMDISHTSHQQRTWVDVPQLETFLAGGS